VAVPTDSSYALACHLDDKAAADRLRQVRGVDDGTTSRCCAAT
jgi:tRNA A37 threonylcarbamoyladenosine synthetase subunit TsaC/SUA5/YrdC